VVARLPRSREKARDRVLSAGGAASGTRSARLSRVSCDWWEAMFSLVTAVSGRNTPSGRSLAHLVWPGLGFPYI
jgi:hypothetical protein